MKRTLKITYSGLFLALGIILPFVSAHGMGIPGTVLLPMHIPVLLCGFMCGPFWGGLMGAVLPVLNSALTGMPVMFPMGIIMSGELFAYGITTGLLYHKTKLGRWKYSVYPILITAMLCGRIMYGLTFELLFIINGGLKAPTVIAAVVAGLPGIIIQLIVVPIIVFTLKQFPAISRKKALLSASNLISEERAVCIVIKDNVIVKTETGRGVAPIIRLYESGILKDAFVVDKVVGKAAAMVMTLGGIKGCHAVTLSKPALDWFKNQGVEVEYDNLTEHIINRTGDGMCPMEQTVMERSDNSDIISILKDKIAQLQGGK